MPSYTNNLTLHMRSYLQIRLLTV